MEFLGNYGWYIVGVAIPVSLEMGALDASNPAAVLAQK